MESLKINYIEPVQEEFFKGKENLKIKYNKYLNEFSKLYPEENIYSLQYDITLIRDLIMYFLYQEKIKKKDKTFNLTVLSKLFKQNSHTGVKYGIDKIEGYLKNPKTLNTKHKTKIFYLFYKYNRIINGDC
ncbi:hypothetical protein [Tenacibaculum finnmarkense]|uniref:Uncharacterized protein n=1 Tax=Tenacibaculum finnmarkense genomovar finnmarkense TaxID=1458503 RepID=A0AAP1RI20_9FLAO|nr:hypothetical protein [Tenacibaculum finnmarkense]MBE7653880.1 hypothetical protein [Tenacibaculum finnmarkense genomovar finnmarkense]MBE7696183.1 hypothetical protein [Tenacibaculum finnmarkense genomovar finnmarkense]MCD8428399.1 hypothetical protein [Tenacibaculum finnmarkense genomovar finnmarkense]MCG8732171.1 hypothetical protein [Tenacibaculum finnmarkense]MCG8752742.1 hypothetical protein [Tenacibaculum finnmarkense]